MTRIFRWAGALVVVPAVAVVLSGSASRPETQNPGPAVPVVDVQAIGPKVGEAVPDFSLRDQRGEVRTLKSLIGPSGAMLVFFRSADW